MTHHFALRATVLIRLQECAGQWVPLSSLAAYTALPSERVLHVCRQLVDSGDAVIATRGDQQYFGTRVEGVPLRPDHMFIDPPVPVQQAAAAAT